MIFLKNYFAFMNNLNYISTCEGRTCKYDYQSFKYLIYLNCLQGVKPIRCLPKPLFKYFKRVRSVYFPCQYFGYLRCSIESRTPFSVAT